jgi:protein-S-isoprenylcysteine O-methyltransferase Ste14
VILAERLYSQGRRLFAQRSIMPLLLLPFVLLALPDSAIAEQQFGETGSVLIKWVALFISLAGLVVRCVTVAYAPDGTSSRDTRGLRAPTLNTFGVYSLVRHPLYLGAGLMWIGVAMSLRVWWLVVIVGLAYWLYIERVAIAEEAFLEGTFADQFRHWASRTPAFLPRFSGWRPAPGTFQVKRVLSEHNGLLAVAIAFALLQYLEDWREPWSQYSADHRDLLDFVSIAIVVSLLCVLFRRSPWMRDAVPDSAAHPTTVQG